MRFKRGLQYNPQRDRQTEFRRIDRRTAEKTGLDIYFERYYDYKLRFLEWKRNQIKRTAPKNRIKIQTLSQMKGNIMSANGGGSFIIMAPHAMKAI